MALAQESLKIGLPIEIISMDSALVYRHMNIGTAKPSQDDLQLVKHHGIDLINPWESYSAAHFANDVHQWVTEIQDRGHQPVIVGGTMLYWRALIQGLSQLPKSTPEIRKAVENKAQEIGWDAMYRELMEKDPITASRLPTGDTQRIGRALEVFMMTGSPMSELIAKSPYGASRDDSSIEHLLVSFEPSERKWLHKRIALRFEHMLENGFLEEVKNLMALPKMRPDLPSMRCVGYRQALEYLNHSITYEEFIAAGIAATRQLGKRQLTWLRAMPSRFLVEASQPTAINQAMSICLNYLEKNARNRFK